MHHCQEFKLFSSIPIVVKTQYCFQNIHCPWIIKETFPRVVDGGHTYWVFVVCDQGLEGTTEGLPYHTKITTMSQRQGLLSVWSDQLNANPRFV